MDPFVWKLALGFAVGGAWITLTTLAAERFGARVGGLIGGLPSTIVVTLLFIGWTQGAQQVRDTTMALPVALAINAVFLLCYAALAERGLAVANVGALAVWFLLQVALVVVDVSSYAIALAIWAVTVVTVYLVMDRALGLRSEERPPTGRAARHLWLRGVLSGAIVASTVVLGRVGGPVVGAAMAAFPAVYVLTLVITSRTVGARFSRAMVVPLMVSSVVNCVVFGIVVRYTILVLGLLGSIVLGYVVSMLSAGLTFLFLQRRRQPRYALGGAPSGRYER